jgi:hypothetical protein
LPSIDILSQLKFTQKHSNQQLLQTSAADKLQNLYQGRSSWLTMRQKLVLQPADLGVYLCVATNFLRQRTTYSVNHLQVPHCVASLASSLFLVIRCATSFHTPFVACSFFPYKHNRTDHHLFPYPTPFPPPPFVINTGQHHHFFVMSTVFPMWATYHLFLTV